MLLVFSLGVLLILVCFFWTLRRTKKQSRAVLLLANGLPLSRVEAALQLFAWRFVKDCYCWYVYVPQAVGLQQAERIRLFSLLPKRLGFSLLSEGECRRLWQEKDCQFFFLSSAGVFYRLNSADKSDWERLFVL